MIKNRINHQVWGLAKFMVLLRLVNSNCGIGKISPWQIIVQKEFWWSHGYRSLSIYYRDVWLIFNFLRIGILEPLIKYLSLLDIGKNQPLSWPRAYIESKCLESGNLGSRSMLHHLITHGPWEKSVWFMEFSPWI